MNWPIRISVHQIDTARLTSMLSGGDSNGFLLHRNRKNATEGQPSLRR